jgi:hypothetical protein
MQPIPRLRPFPLFSRDDAKYNAEMLEHLFPGVNEAQRRENWRNVECERKLAAFFDVACDTLARDDDEARTEELENVIAALQGRAAYASRNGPYSLAVQITINGWGRAEVAMLRPQTKRWWIARSYIGETEVCTRPGVALMIAAAKAEFDVFDGWRRCA